MDRSFQSFDDEYHPQITSTLNTVVDHVQEKMKLVPSSDIDEDVRILGEACNDCVQKFQSKMDEIKTSVRRRKPDKSSPTYPEDKKKYKAYVEATAHGVENTKSLFDKVFERLRGIVSYFIECLKTGVDYIWNQLNEAFAAVKELWN